MPGGWERLASHEGGTVVALATALTRDSATTLFAATATGLFRSEDSGRRWSAVGEKPLPLLTAIVPSAGFAENALLLAGTQTGFHRSTDGGRTWRQTLADARVFAIAVVPGDGGEESVFIGTDADGILRSNDGGKTWAGANPGLLDFTVLALAFSPDFTRDLTGFAATASGLYRTRNGGKSWRAVDLPLDEPAVQCLSVSPAFSRDRLVLAGTEGDGLWRSDDGGGTWLPVRDLPEGSIDAVAVSPASHRLAVATARGIALSHDDGATWRLTGETLPPVLDLAFISDCAGETLVAGLHRGGIARLAVTEGEDQWRPANRGLSGILLSALVASPTLGQDSTLFAAGPEAGVRVSRDAGVTWGDAGLAGEGVNGLTIAPSAGGAYVIVAATDAGIFRSRNCGSSWEPPVSGGDMPVAIVAAGSAASVFAATVDSRLIVSEDGGERWQSLAAPFNDVTVVALACGPERIIYAGTFPRVPIDDAGDITLWRSTDGGRSWARWLEERGSGATLPLTAPRGVMRSGDVETLFVGSGARVLHPRPNAWQTRRAARSPLWHAATLASSGGGPVTVTALVTSPNHHLDGAVYAATSAGIYRSRDRGRAFEDWSEDLGSAPVIALTAAHGAGNAPFVFAVTVDGTIWRRRGDA